MRKTPDLDGYRRLAKPLCRLVVGEQQVIHMQLSLPARRDDPHMNRSKHHVQLLLVRVVLRRAISNSTKTERNVH
jgi:hypothetical protein